MWYLCHGQIAAVTEERGIPNFIVIPTEYRNEEDLPGFDHFPHLYGPEYPPTPANAVTTGAAHITTSGTMYPAQLQESTQNNGSPPGLARASEVVSSDITRLAPPAEIGEVELQQMYKKMLQNIFQSNLESLSNHMIRATFDLAANAHNKSTLLQYW